MSVREHARGLWMRLFGKRLQTRFGTTRVYEIKRDGNLMRVLDVNGTFQSAMLLDENRWCDPPFPYLAQFDCVFERPEPVRDLCMLGGGGYAYPRHVLAHHRDARIDVVEIDPCITQIAFERFRLGECIERYCANNPNRLRIVTAGALDHLHSCAQAQRHYDAILNDCFAARLPDSELGSNEAIRLIRSCLNPNGVYATNLISALEGEDAAPLLELVGTLGNAFAHVLVLPSARVAPDERDNVMVVATDDAFMPNGSIRLYDAL